jgi:hypothetical protein
MAPQNEQTLLCGCLVNVPLNFVSLRSESSTERDGGFARQRNKREDCVIL